MWLICDRFDFAFFFKTIKNNIKNKSSPSISLLTSKIYIMEDPILSKYSHLQN